MYHGDHVSVGRGEILIRERSEASVSIAEEPDSVL